MAQDQTIHLIVDGLEKATRLDRVIRNAFPQWGRRSVQTLITAGKVKINGRKVWLCSWRVNNGDRLDIFETPPAEPEPVTTFDDNWLIAQEHDLIVVNKPAGLLCQAPRWRQTSNLLDLATARFGPLSLFHRLDRDTSGVVLLTRSGPINRYLDVVFKNRAVQKEYLAVVPAKNELLPEGVIDARIGPHPKRRDMMTVVARGGKRAVTRYQVIRETAGKQWVRLWPETGRTHQLRVHLWSMGAPILGDRLYGPHQPDVPRLMLHACQISLPAAEGFPARVYAAPLPKDFLGSFLINKEPNN